MFRTWAVHETLKYPIYHYVNVYQLLDLIASYQTVPTTNTIQTPVIGTMKIYETYIFSTSSEETNMVQHLWHDVTYITYMRFSFPRSPFHRGFSIPAPTPRDVTQAQHARLAQIELPIGQEPPVQCWQNLGEFTLVPQK